MKGRTSRPDTREHLDYAQAPKKLLASKGASTHSPFDHHREFELEWRHK